MIMRTIHHLVVHCTATSQRTTIDSLRRHFKQLGWNHPGYHWVVAPGGNMTNLLDEALVANGVKGHNATSIHVAYIGGIDAAGRAVDNRTGQQKQALRTLLCVLKRRYPGARIVGHRDFSPDLDGNGRIDPGERIKECPCFDAAEEYRNISAHV